MSDELYIKYEFRCPNCGHTSHFSEEELSKDQKHIIELQYPDMFKKQ